MKKVMSLALSTVLLISTVVLSAFTNEGTAITASAPNGNTIPITAVNQPITAADQLILFTRENASKQTDGNIYAAAAIVDLQEGAYKVSAVKDRQGAVDIPTNGFVLFGHGTSEDWILANLHSGDEVVISGYTLPAPIAGQQLVVEGGATHAIDAVDQDRQPNQLVIYTRDYGNTTKPFGNDTVEYIVSGNSVVVKSTYEANGARGTYIPNSGYVISASGTARDALGSLELGTEVQTVNVDITLLPSKYFTINGKTVGITSVNGPRGESAVVLYNPSYGSSTNTNPWGMEITVVGNSVTRVVALESDPVTGGFKDNNSPIPADGYVLSVQIGNEAYARLNGHVNVGDTVELVMNSPVYSAAKTKYNGLNSEVRGADQLIVYDSNFGARTGTNPWGTEAVVNANGFIVSVGGNDKEIPVGGYVLSGHGINNTWLTNNALIGAKVIINQAKQEVLIIFTPESYIDKATISIDAVEQALEVSRSQFLDVPYADITQKIANAKASLEQVKQHMAEHGTNGLFELLNVLDAKVTDALYMNYESRKVEMRGVWLRPKEKNIEQVREHLQKLKETNVNAIFLEAWWDGYTTWPTSIQDTQLNPIYDGFNVLQAYIDEGKKLGIEIHAWVENFFAGGPVVQNHPDWRLISRQGQDYEDGGNGVKWYWLNPALPQTRDFVASVYKELVTNFDIESIHLDYARYPGSGNYTNDFGYDAYTREQFLNKYGSDPLNLHPGDADWEQWLQFRADIINTWVERVVKDAHQIKPNLQITAAVWPNYHEAPKSHAQQTQYWLDHNLIDHLFHMSYAPGAAIVVDDLKNSLALARNHSFVSSGIDTFQGNPPAEVVNQANEVNRNGAAGTGLFEFEGLFNYGYDKVLKLGVYRDAAVVPDYRSTKAVSTLLNDMIRKIDNIYVPFQGMSDKEALKYKQQLKTIAAVMKNKSEFNHGIATAVNVHVNNMIRDITNSQTLHAEVKARMLVDLQFAGQMLDIYLAKEK